jgi:hypothetical protein
MKILSLSDCARDHEKKIRWIIKDWFRCDSDFKLQLAAISIFFVRCDNIMMLYSELKWDEKSAVMRKEEVKCKKKKLIWQAHSTLLLKKSV